MNIKNINIFTFVGALLIGPATALAVPIVYTTEASWLTALGGATVTSENFEASPLGNLAVGTTDVGLFDISITSNAEGQIGIAGGGNINGSRQFNGDIDSDSTLSMNFSNFGISPLSAFAGEWASTTSGDLLTLSVNGSLIEFDNYLAGAGNGFLGFIDTDGFTSMTFGTEGTTSFGEFFNLDNVQVASVPEPGTLFLLAAGLLGLSFGRKIKTV